MADNSLFKPIKEMSTITDSVIVAFSGGKDSVVTMDLCKRYIKNVYVFFMYYVNDLSFQNRIVEWCERKYGVTVLRLPHFEVSEFINNGCYCVEDPNSPIIKINDIYAYVRQYFGCEWIAAGERVADSMWRRAMIKQSGYIDHKRKRLYPVANFNKSHILSYIKANKLKISEEHDILGHSFNGLQAESLLAIKAKYPNDFEKIRKVFPFCMTEIKRMEFFRNE